MKKFLLALTLISGFAHAESTWNKISTRPNADGTMNEVLLLADNMSCTGVNFVKFNNFLNEKTSKHFMFVQAVSFSIYRSKNDTIVVALPGPTTEFIDVTTKEVLAKANLENGKKEIVFPKTILGDIFSTACAKELAEAEKPTTKKLDT